MKTFSVERKKFLSLPCQDEEETGSAEEQPASNNLDHTEQEMPVEFSTGIDVSCLDAYG